jgi:hypothetical protein
MVFQASSSELDGRHAGDPGSNSRGCAHRVGATFVHQIFTQFLKKYLFAKVHLLHFKKQKIMFQKNKKIWKYIRPVLPRLCFFSYAAIVDQSKPSHLQVKEESLIPFVSVLLLTPI